MLNDELKEQIQQAYSNLLTNKDFKARRCQTEMVAAIANTLGNIAAPHTLGEVIEAVEIGDASDLDDIADLGEVSGATEGGATSTCVVEAGTGTGKTIAYAVAAIPIAKTLKKKLVISTATIALQEQIVYQDLPDISEHSGLPVSFLLAKGRRRYLCLAKLDKALRGSAGKGKTGDLFGDTEETEAAPSDPKLFTDMQQSFRTGEWPGDRESWPREVADSAWMQVSTDHAQCTQRRCSHFDDCVFYKARENIHTADCIVTNHDLVLADLAMGGGTVLPEPEETIYIFDEGHHLPDKAANHLSHTLAIHATQKFLEKLPGAVTLAASNMEITDITNLVAQAEASIRDTLSECARELTPLYEQASEEGDARVYRFPLGVVPDELAALARSLHERFDALFVEVERFTKEISEQMDQAVFIDRPEAEHYLAEFNVAMDRLADARGLWHSFGTLDEDMPHARWVRFHQGASEGLEVHLSSSPISVAKTLAEQLWQRSAGVVVTSATLSIGGDFSDFQRKTGITPESHFLSLQSPFDFPRNGRLRIPRMASDPKDGDAHTEEITELIPELIEADTGSLVLFTSRWQMRRVLEDLDDDFRERVLDQGRHSKLEILRRHKRAVDAGEKSSIFGLASFAEGIDLPGDYCTHVVIAKIPFAVPDDPVGATLSEWIEQQGGNSFMEVMVPDAAIRLIQMCGRLLRTENDHGQVTILDRRLLTKFYGKRMLKALPPFALETQ